MENFVVSARKYRPATFESVIGQEHITNTLKNAIKNNQLAHAFLFCGPRGVGKTTCARILAKTINCLHITADSEACNECDSCKSFNQNVSFNIYELDAASNNSVDDIRGLVEQVRYAPQGAKYKIYIIDEVHMLSSAAFNAFLKTLEEPPAYATFILATTERHKILPTILSRCQVFDFHRIKIESAVQQLHKIIANEGIIAEEEALHIIAQKADGAMRDALSIFDRIVSSTGKNITYKDVINNLNVLDYDYYFRGVECMLKQDLSSILLLFDEILSNGFDSQHFLVGFSEHIRNLLVCKYPNTAKLLEVAPSLAARFMQQSQACSATLMLNALNLLNKCELDYKASKNNRLHVELTLMKLCHIQTIVQLKSEGVDIKKKIDITTPIANISQAITTISIPKNNAEQTEVRENKEPIAKQIPTPSTVKTIAGGGSSLGKLERIKQDMALKANTQTDEVKSEANNATDLYSNTFTKVELDEYWKLYIEQLLEMGKNSLAVIYKDIKPLFLENNLVELTLHSQHEREMLEEDRINLTPYLRSNLKNSFLDFTYKIEINQLKQQKVFTSEDKFKVMAEKNPILNELVQTFGLELE